MVKQNLNTNRLLFDVSDDDISLITLNESDSTEVPNVYSSTNIPASNEEQDDLSIEMTTQTP